MVEAGRELAGSAVLLPDAEAGASDAGAVPAAAGPPAGLSGGTCNCKTNANYKGRRLVAGAMPRGQGQRDTTGRCRSESFIRAAFGLCWRLGPREPQNPFELPGASRRTVHGDFAAMMTGIGNAERVALMERLVALEVEHRDLDGVIQRVADHSHDQLQLTRLKRRKLLLKDQIAWIQRQIDPDVSA